MKKLLGLLISLGLVFAVTQRVEAVIVWCMCSQQNRDIAIRFFHQREKVYEALSRGVMLQWHEANAHLENGVLAEFDHLIAPKANRLNPEAFKRALAGYEQVALALAALDRELEK